MHEGSVWYGRETAPGMHGMTCNTHDSLATCVKSGLPGPTAPSRHAALAVRLPRTAPGCKATAQNSSHQTLKFCGACKPHGADDYSAGKKPGQRRPKRQPRALLQHRPVAAQRCSPLLRARSLPMASRPAPAKPSTLLLHWCLPDEIAGAHCGRRRRPRAPGAGRSRRNRRTRAAAQGRVRGRRAHREQVALVEAGERAL